MAEITIYYEDDSIKWTYGVEHPDPDKVLDEAARYLVGRIARPDSVTLRMKPAQQYYEGTETPVNYYDKPGEFHREAEINRLKNELSAERERIKQLQQQLWNQPPPPNPDDDIDYDWRDEDDDGLAGVREPRR